MVFYNFLLTYIFLLYNSIYFDIPRDEIENKYAKPPSDFIILDDGSRIHYRDEGNLMVQQSFYYMVLPLLCLVLKN